jgi:hypothetical protein
MTFIPCMVRLCGLVIRVPGYLIQRSRARFPALPDVLKIVDPDRDALSLVRMIEQLLERKNSGSGLENRD